MTFISFKAECNKDWEQLKKELSASGISFELQNYSEDMGECEIELQLNNASIEDVFECMVKVKDGHVMCDTVRPVPLIENSLNRRYNQLGRGLGNG